MRDISNITVPWESTQEVWRDGPYSIVRSDSQWDWWLETYFLAHCLGTKNHAEFSKAHVVYSLRDTFGIPHATILCVREDEFSPYGRCWDVGSHHNFQPEQESVRILQVRGRNDDLAMAPYHAIVRDWYVQNGGIIQVPIDKFVEYIMRVGDPDVDYHFRYKLDQRNGFLWTHWNERMRVLALLEGTSL
jgi:hypothetical protein